MSLTEIEIRKCEDVCKLDVSALIANRGPIDALGEFIDAAAQQGIHLTSLVTPHGDTCGGVDLRFCLHLYKHRDDAALRAFLGQLIVLTAWEEPGYENGMVTVMLSPNHFDHPASLLLYGDGDFGRLLALASWLKAPITTPEEDHHV